MHAQTEVRACFPRVLEGFQPISVAVRRTYPRIILLTGIDVVVVPVGPGLSQFLRGLRCQESQRRAYFDANLTFYPAYGPAQAVKFGAGRRSPTSYDAEPLGLGRTGLAGALDYALLFQERILLYRRVGRGRLRTVRAVFGTHAALSVEQHVQHNLLPEVLMPHGKRGLQQFEKALVRTVQDGQTLIPVQ